MGRKNDGILALAGVFVFIIYGIPKIFETLQSDLNLVDRLINISNVLPYPWNIYTGIAALVALSYAFDRLQKTRWPS